MEKIINDLTAAVNSETLLIIQVLISLFLAILFLQSGIDKLIDWKGNLSWLKGHFGNSPLKNMVPIMLGIVMITEIAAGALSALGVIALISWGTKTWALRGAVLAAINLVFLFFGQRIAKDYVGAAVLVNYFILTIIGILFLG